MRMRLFLTVGSQMPFDRLTAAVARWSREHPGHEVVAQVGRTALPRAELQGLDWTALMAPADHSARCAWADLIVAHAGMGSVLTALDHGKPLLVMPRRGALRETRNDHQVDTARRLRQWPGVAVAMDPPALAAMLDRWCAHGWVAPRPDAGPRPERQRLIDHLGAAIRNGRRRAG